VIARENYGLRQTSYTYGRLNSLLDPPCNFKITLIRWLVYGILGL